MEKIMFLILNSPPNEGTSLKDLITFILTVVGLVIAGMGLATWKKQIKGTKEFETAYNLNYSILKLRNAIKHVRNPGIWPSESIKAEQDAKKTYPDLSPEEIQKNSHAHVYEIRCREILSASAEMESHLLATEVLWGSEILNRLKPLNKKITELNISLLQYFQPRLRVKSFQELYEIVYDMSTEETEDRFSKEVSQAVEEIKNYIKSEMSHF